MARTDASSSGTPSERRNRLSVVSLPEPGTPTTMKICCLSRSKSDPKRVFAGDLLTVRVVAPLLGFERGDASRCETMSVCSV